MSITIETIVMKLLIAILFSTKAIVKKSIIVNCVLRNPAHLNSCSFCRDFIHTETTTGSSSGIQDLFLKLVPKL